MKMDKREIILCLLFACLFITMIFIRAFAVDAADPGSTLPVHGKQSALDILADDTSYNTWLDNLRASGADVATNIWSTASDMARNLLAYGVGCVANVSEEVLQVAFPDLENYLGDMYFDWDRLQWEFTDPEDVEEFIKTGLDPYEYSSGTDSYGSWKLMNQTIYYPYYGRNYPLSSTSLYDVWVCIVREDYNNLNRWILWSSKDPDFVPGLSGYGLNSSTPNTYTANGNTYYWVLSSQMYSAGGLRWGSSSGPECGVYQNHNTALSALWGSGEPDSEPTFSGDVLYFDAPQFEPLGYYPSSALDFTSIVTEGNTNNYDYSVVNTYNTYYPSTFTFDIPYWLYVPSTTPKLYDLPSDYDFGNIQFDYEADSSFLSGAGIVQDVYEILPSRLQNLIILFGAGTCAFIFLRR